MLQDDEKMKNIAKLANSLTNELFSHIGNNDADELDKAILYGIIADRCRERYLNLINNICNSEVTNE